MCYWIGVRNLLYLLLLILVIWCAKCHSNAIQNKSTDAMYKFKKIQDESNVEITRTGKLAYKHENERRLQYGGK